MKIPSIVASVILVSSLVGGANAATPTPAPATSCSSITKNTQCKDAGCDWVGGSTGCVAQAAPNPTPAPVAPTPAPVTNAPVATTPAPATPAPQVVCSSLKSTDCGNAPDCQWANGNCVDISSIDCSSRNNGKCENDDLCILLNGGICQNVNGGNQTYGETCYSSMQLADDGVTIVYVGVPGKGCASGFICTLDNISNTTQVGDQIEGTCVPTSCNGKKVPGNCNGNADTIPSCNATTQRVTICHRTCSRKNPWVRITIDEDAWSGEGCGHMLQHDVTDDCANEFPWTEWGVNRRDYLIKFHGTRDHVKQINDFTTAEAKAYWRIWEPACPYVRNGKCCEWNNPDNPCCGDAPTPSPTPAPTVVGECPYVTLDFENLPNPASKYYNQGSVLQAGDYLFDQLWFSHGVKVSARIKDSSTSGIFIPLYDRHTQSWVSITSQTNPSNIESGGAVRLFDTSQPTCASGGGDAGLGAPNALCPVSGSKPGEFTFGSA